MVTIAAVGTAQLPASLAAVLLGIACIATRPVVGSAIVIVAANDVHLFRDPALGSVSAIDVAIAATFVRATLTASRRRPSLLELCALGFLVVAGVATVFAHTNSAITAYGRVGSYLIFGLAIGRALSRGDRPQLARAFVGAQIGQAGSALIGLTPTASTDFPIGRYLGTLGDPAQFGIPLAFAAILVIFSPHLIRSRHARYAFAVLLCLAVAGSVTRSAWSVLGMGFLLAALTHAGRAKSITARIGLGLAGFGLASFATAVVILGAGALGLTEESATIRQRSIVAAWNHFRQHPLRPTGLGNAVDLASEPVADDPIFASSFERDTSGWTPFRNAMLARKSNSAIFGSAALEITTPGHTRNEGVQLSTIGGLRPNATYTVSLYAKAPRGLSLWIYVDEYSATDKWHAFGYSTLKGTGEWQQHTWTWTTSSSTAHLRLYLLTASKIATVFFVDGVQLDAVPIATSFEGREKLPPIILKVSGIYNTWLAVAIQLGIAAAVLLAALAIGAPYHVYRLGDHAGGFALAALLIPSLTEGLVYGASFVTLIWFATLGLAATAGESRPR